MKPYPRRQYWNSPTMSWWERAYIFEIVRGLCITGGIFTRNMWRWMTGRKGALTTYYPEETRADYAPGTPWRTGCRRCIAACRSHAARGCACRG